MSQPKYKAVIFDIDGTLIDSNDAHAHAWVEALTEKGFEAIFEQLRELIGEGGDKILPKVAGVEKDSPQGKAISERRAAIFDTKYLPDLQPFPGAHALLETLRDRGLQLAVATSAQTQEVEKLLKVADANEFFDQKASSKDARQSKPDPDVVQAALAKLGLVASEALLVGDTPYDITGAKRAGVAAVGLRCGGWSDAKLADALAIYDNPADMLHHLDETGLGR